LEQLHDLFGNDDVAQREQKGVPEQIRGRFSDLVVLTLMVFADLNGESQPVCWEGLSMKKKI
jgi:hypothetical protein